MNYHLVHFTLHTWDAFQKHGCSTIGFPKHAKKRAAKITTGDTFICYLIKVSRWSGAIEVLEGPHEDDTPIFSPANDKYVVRFRVKPLVVLNVDSAIPIEELWNSLKRTRDVDRSRIGWAWAAGLTTSLAPMDSSDGDILLEKLLSRLIGKDDSISILD